MTVGGRMRKSVAAAVVAVLIVGAAAILLQGSRPTTVVAPTEVSPTVGLPIVSISPSPTTSIAAAPTPTPPLVLRSDGMATIAAPGGIVVWSAPGTGKAEALTPHLDTGAVVYLIEGPRHAHGFDWWEVQADFVPRVGGPFGWIHAADSSKRPTLVPFAPDCPPSDAPIEREVTKSLGTLKALACFGGREVTLRGQLSCYSATIDSAIGGASWLGVNASCSIDDTFWLEGPVVFGVLEGTPPSNPVVGPYEVRGHFDDPEAAGCSWIPFGTSMLSPSGRPDPGAVIACRQAFVVTAVTKLS